MITLLFALLCLAPLILIPGVFNFSRGDFCPVSMQPINGTVSVLNIRGQSIGISCLAFDVTSTGAGGQTMKLAGKLDGKGTVNGQHDIDLPLYLIPPFVQPQVSGIAAFFLSPTRAIQLPNLITKLHYSSSTEEAVAYSFDVEMNSRFGFLVYPPL